MIVDAVDECLEKQTPKDEGELLWDPRRIKWAKTEGTKGGYERYPAKDEKAEATVDYKNMLEDLKRHGNKMNREGLFYWLFPDHATVGRKKQK